MRNLVRSTVFASAATLLVGSAAPDRSFAASPKLVAFDLVSLDGKKVPACQGVGGNVAIDDQGGMTMNLQTKVSAKGIAGLSAPKGTDSIALIMSAGGKQSVVFNNSRSNDKPVPVGARGDNSVAINAAKDELLGCAGAVSRENGERRSVIYLLRFEN